MTGDTFGRSPLARQLSDAQQEYIKRHIREVLLAHFPGGVLPKRLGGTGNQGGAGTGGAVNLDAVLVDDDGAIVVDDDFNIVTES